MKVWKNEEFAELCIEFKQIRSNFTEGYSCVQNIRAPLATLKEVKVVLIMDDDRIESIKETLFNQCSLIS